MLLNVRAKVKRRFFFIRNCWVEREELDQEVHKEAGGRGQKNHQKLLNHLVWWIINVCVLACVCG